MDPPASWLSGYRGLDPLLQKIVLSALILLVGWAAIKTLTLILNRGLRRSPRTDATLIGFLEVVVRIGGWLVVFFILLGTLGINVTALLGGLAIGGFIVGFALKDTLGNLAAGVVLLVYRPFNVGDTVTIKNHEGDVRRLGMALTTLKAGDGRIITIPNGAVLGDAIVNHTREPIRRADVAIGISYKDDINGAIKAILAALAQDDRVLSTPAPGVRVTALGDNAVNLLVRPWVQTQGFWQTRADLHAVVKQAVEDAGCSIPYPQRDIHIIERREAPA